MDHWELVQEHIRCENAHDLRGTLATFGASGCYHDEPWDDHRTGIDGVRSYYEELMAALPDLHIEVVRRHVTSDAVIVEVMISGTHQGAWRGLPGTGRGLNFPLCGTYTFDADGRLAGERIYYDRASVLRQLGVFFEPTTLVGKVMIGLTHPLTVGRAYARLLFRRSKSVSPA